MDAVVRSRIDLLVTGEPNDHIYECARPAAHELATTILIDVSLSTDSWVDNRRVRPDTGSLRHPQQFEITSEDGKLVAIVPIDY